MRNDVITLDVVVRDLTIWPLGLFHWKDNTHQGRMKMSEINKEAIVGLAISTAFLRSGWSNDTSIDEVEEVNGWDEILDLARQYIDWAGIGAVTIDESNVRSSIWGED